MPHAPFSKGTVPGDGAGPMALAQDTMLSINTVSRGQAALTYAALGWPVLPVYTANGAGCSCGSPGCKDPGKHPLGSLVEHGVLEATSDPATIQRWWTKKPAANPAIATGRPSGVVALDVDPAKGGDVSLARLIAEHGALPPTLVQRTGSGGRHYLFKHPGPGVHITNAVRLAGWPGLDVRGDGGFIVAGTSEHVSGGRYQWESDPSCTPVAPLPAWLLALMQPPASRDGAGQPFVVPPTITEGERNATLFRLGRSLHAKGVPPSVAATALGVVNAEQCEPPLDSAEVDRIAQSAASQQDRPEFRAGSPGPGSQNGPAGSGGVDVQGGLWSAQPAPDFINAPEAEASWLDHPILASGVITALFSPRGVGKTHVGDHLAVKLARAGKRVLKLDRDNPRSEIRRRLRGWGAGETPGFKIITREKAPPLTDAEAWARFPYTEYDAVIIDSIDATSEGVGEKDSAKPSKAIAAILDVARRPGAPAILLLGNTVRTGAHSRGSGVIEDRMDIVYEVRDITDFRPSGRCNWWEELPPADAGSWAQRASRRKRRERYRLAFVPSKFRVGEEPEPFVFEIALPDDAPWTLHEVTDEVVATGEATHQEAEQGRRSRLDRAASALAARVEELARAGKPMLADKHALPFLVSVTGLRRAEARKLLDDGEGRLWRTVCFTDKRGQPRGLFPPAEPTPARSGECFRATAEIRGS